MDPEVERLKKKVENYPSPSSYNRLAELLKQNGQLDDAKAMCTRSMKDFPRNGQAYVIVAEMHYERQQTNDAMAMLRQAVENDPRCYGAHMLLAKIYMDAGHPTHAIKHLDYILKVRPKDQPAAARLAEARNLANARNTAAPTTSQSTPNAGAQNLPPKRENSTVDLNGMATGLTSIVQRQETSDSTTPNPTVSNDSIASKSPEDLLAEYCQQKGVRCATVADNQGRSLATKNLPPGLDDLVAALAREITELSSDSLESIEAGRLVSWSVTAENGQVLSFNEDDKLSLIAIADTDVKMAMLEHRARQTITEIGGG